MDKTIPKQASIGISSQKNGNAWRKRNKFYLNKRSEKPESDKTQ